MRLSLGDVAWVDLGVRVGREQAGRRPAVVIASDRYLVAADQLAIVVPLTSRQRGWANHIRVTGHTGLSRPTWAMAEQPTTVSRGRILEVVGTVDPDCLGSIRTYLRDFLDL